jgi:hypothetical protein
MDGPTSADIPPRRSCGFDPPTRGSRSHPRPICFASRQRLCPLLSWFPPLADCVRGRTHLGQLEVLRRRTVIRCGDLAHTLGEPAPSPTSKGRRGEACCCRLAPMKQSRSVEQIPGYTIHFIYLKPHVQPLAEPAGRAEARPGPPHVRRQVFIFAELCRSVRLGSPPTGAKVI